MSYDGIEYRFTAIAWQHSAPGGWYFVSLPEILSKEIRYILKTEEQGWGRLKAKAKIGSTKWETAIWFDTKRNTYLLPLKAEIRKKENLSVGKEIEIVLWI
jgi:hypothetical protein